MNHHFFLSSPATWCTTGLERTLTEAIKLMDAEKLSYCIYYIPLPPDEPYEINYYMPQVKDAVLVELVAFKNGRRVKPKQLETA